jgi:uncharacterized protein (DUF885 family)
MPDPELHAVAGEYWDSFLATYPSYATMIGDRRFDDRLEDVSVEAEDALRSSWEGFRDRLAAIPADRLDGADRVTAALLESELSDGLAGIEQRLVEQAWGQLSGVHTEFLMAAAELNAPTADSAGMLAGRLALTGRLLDQAAARFRHAVATGRTPPQANVERSIATVDRYLASPVEDDPWARFPGPEGWDGESAWREQLVTTLREVVRPAFERYRAVLADELAPVARPADRPGLTWIPGGDEQYRTLVRRHTSLDMDPQDIHDLGRADVEERLPAEYAAVGARALGTSDVGEILERLRSDPGLRYGPGRGGDIIADAQRGLDAAKAAMGEWFGRLPVAPCELRPVPDVLAADAPVAYYVGPPADGSRPGMYYVNTHDPASNSTFETASIAFHEAIPGHHLQIAISTELEGLPAFQRFSTGHTAYVEGWGLYSERLAEEMGLYERDLDRLGMLAADSLRSCRLVVDTGLHALGWSRQQAIDFMAAHAPASLESITVEVDRYIDIPGQALAYRVGQREIFRLRATAQERLGEAFDVKGFHDTVLGSGAVTLPVLAMLVARWADSVEPAAAP